MPVLLSSKISDLIERSYPGASCGSKHFMNRNGAKSGVLAHVCCAD
jgi:hypothetical protein